mmetsp:Transcript_23540/g.54830  ORF Transcript_23540/g.54830 Transcript_23540/m.54830 type:complete len:204 (-) Transcript_23540:49-660(-)
MSEASGRLQMATGTNTCTDHPCSIVWAVIPILSHVFPAVGHTMVTDSKGQLYDFAGHVPAFGRSGVCHNVGIFGEPVRVLKFKPSCKVSQEEFEDDWDKAVEAANQAFERQMHMGLVNNCHSHVASVVNNARCVENPKWLQWNVLVVGAAMLFLGRFIPADSYCCRGWCFRVWFCLWPLLVFYHLLKMDFVAEWVQTVVESPA